ncbi:hypothetical protein VNO78_00190 [Psophocarpus tetragonolobus]|uniref:DUF7086 domain-containing protein n=1 Tax=Psophocarpus tetragonolobus TaxID=3891 RepID=A0AAN9T037_PSOTE
MDSCLGVPAKKNKNSMESEDEHDDLTLTLGCGGPKKPTKQSSPSPSLSQQIGTCPNPNPNSLLVPSSGVNPFLVSSLQYHNANTLFVSSSYPPSTASLLAPSGVSPTPVLRRSRRVPTAGRRKGETVPPPFPWATESRATIHSRNYLLQKNIVNITGKVQCKRCEHEFETSFNLEEKVAELRQFIQKERGSMHDRAPAAWMSPLLLKCSHCGRENCAKPILGKKKDINWLFLLLGQMLGCCTLDQLKYFCKHTNNHRTGAKDRLLYLTYMTLYNQLLPHSSSS